VANQYRSCSTNYGKVLAKALMKSTEAAGLTRPSAYIRLMELIRQPKEAKSKGQHQAMSDVLPRDLIWNGVDDNASVTVAMSAIGCACGVHNPLSDRFVCLYRSEKVGFSLFCQPSHR
jgi:hypothetical protein